MLDCFACSPKAIHEELTRLLVMYMKSQNNVNTWYAQCIHLSMFFHDKLSILFNCILHPVTSSHPLSSHSSMREVERMHVASS